MFNFLAKFFRSKRGEVEAKLYPTPECQFGGVGEVEIETWSDGAVELEVSIKHTGIPDGTKLDVCFGGRKVLSLVVAQGYAKQWLKSSPQVVIPAINIGDEAEIQYQGNTLYRGQFRPD